MPEDSSHKIDLTILGDLFDAINELKNSHNPSKDEMDVITDAISLYYIAYKNYSKGEKVFVICVPQEGETRLIKFPFNR